MRILGIDPGLRRCGWGVVAASGARLTWVGHGVIAPDPAAPLALRLAALYAGIATVVASHAPDTAAIEETFVNANPASALKLGHARAAALLGAANAGLAVAEYAPLTIKKAVVGAARADKVQVAAMIDRLLPGARAGGAAAAVADAADALAVAVCHAHHARAPGRVLGVESLRA